MMVIGNEKEGGASIEYIVTDHRRVRDLMVHDCQTRLAELGGTHDGSPNYNLGRGKQRDAIRANIVSPQVDDRGPRLMSNSHKRHREKVPNLMTQSLKEVGHDIILEVPFALEEVCTESEVISKGCCTRSIWHDFGTSPTPELGNNWPGEKRQRWQSKQSAWGG